MKLYLTLKNSEVHLPGKTENQDTIFFLFSDSQLIFPKTALLLY